MALIWGAKPTDSNLGYVVDNCSVCCELSKIEVHRVELTGKKFLISVWHGQYIGSYGICCSCHNKIALELSDYVYFHKDKQAGLKDVMRLTNPRLESASGKLVKQYERFTSLRAPFLKYGQYLNESTCSETNFDKTSGFAFLVTFAIPIGLGYLLSYIPKPPSIDLIVTKSLFGLFCVSFIFSLVVFFRHAHRVIRKRTLPKIVEELAPLKPKESEIELVLKKLKLHGHRISKYIDTKSIVKALTKVST
jgi:hypothetical protein